MCIELEKFSLKDLIKNNKYLIYKFKYKTREIILKE